MVMALEVGGLVGIGIVVGGAVMFVIVAAAVRAAIGRGLGW